ncbi:MAG TPA: DUF1801 domain-containing protein [Draconibacterium sp.]|nr:DUF1801 domain-containing protein [Draconibacterium sp.]HRX11784.1 DUF1801 domain-containing protein [Draconibacterium sp.]
MKSFKTVDEYILNAGNGKEILIVLREIIRSTELKETIKWGGPVYTFEDKNVVGIGSFKSYVGLWFFQGAFLKDEENVLINAQTDITKALRQWRFSSADEINDKLLLKYINEAIQNQKLGIELKPDRNKPVVIPDELLEVFKEDNELEKCFKNFTPGRQREFADFVSSAKLVETRRTRIQKIIPLILENIGLNDKYRK